MWKQVAAVLVLVIGGVAVLSQVFRDDPNLAIFGGGAIIAFFGLMGFSDAKAAR